MLIRKLVVALLGCFFLMSLTMAHAEQTPAKKKWTFMVFLNGNNNLDSFGEENIKAMEKVGSNDEVNIVVQWASLERGKVTRLYIQKSSDPHRVTSPVIEDLGRVDMGSPATLENFIAWTVKHYPADHYFIDVWNHGSGWAKKRLVGNRDISWDDLTGNSISTEQLGQVMARAALYMGHKVDIYGSDACLMGMVEVANEMSDSVQYFVGSQEVEPGEGWPYTQLLARWQSLRNAAPADVAKMWPQEFVKAYQPGGVYPKRSVTMSAYDLSKLPVLNEKLHALGVSVRSLSPQARARLLSRVKEVQKFAYRDYADLIDFMTVISTASQQGIPLDEIENVMTAAKAMIIANKTTAGYAHATGLSVWLPADNATYKGKAERYKHLRFSMSTEWNQTLESLLQGVNHQSQQQDQQDGERANSVIAH